MLTAHELEHRYGDRVVLDVKRLALPPASMTALVGPNGSGKSTLLRILAFVERPTTGELRLEGRPITNARERRAARRVVTLVEQHPLLFDMTVGENLDYALRLAGRRGTDASRRTAAALERVGLAGLAGRRARTLSGGETQRIALARALLLAPRVLLLDEPLSAADRTARNDVAELLERLRGDGATICLSSHRLEDAYRWASHILALADGRLSPATPENLFRVVVPPGSGARRVRAGPLEFVVVTDRTGAATLAISPDDIIVSTEPLHSSVRNAFPGRVVGISDDGRGHVRLRVDAGVELVARITPGALAELGISVGSSVVLSVKALAVQVF